MQTFVVTFQIIGFENFIEETELTKALADQEHNFKTMLNEAVIGPHNRSVDDFPMDVLGFAQVLDCFILWAPELTHAYFVKLIMSAILVMRVSVENGFALKGYMGIADLGNIPIGGLKLSDVQEDELKRAYEKAQSQCWIGCMVDENAIDVFHSLGKKEDASLATLEKGGMLIRYPVPLTDGENAATYVINWPPEDFTRTSLIAALKKHKHQKASGEILSIILHTETFISHIKGASYN